MLILFVLEILVVNAYMFSGILGFIISLIMFSYIWKNKKYNIFIKLIISLVLSVPIFQISIIGESLPHIFSWFMIFLIILIMYLLINAIKNKVKFSNTSLILVIIALGIVFINSIRGEYYVSNLVKFLQLLLMVVPIFLYYQQRKFFSNYMSDDLKNELEKIINISIVSTAIAIFVEYILYSYFGIRCGNISRFSGRTTYDYLFQGYSVLSIYLGIGVVLNLNILTRKIKIKNIIMILICLVAIVVNSSRTGLISAMAICAIILLLNAFKSFKQLMLSLIIAIIGIGMCFIMMGKILENREGSNILDDNGRVKGYVQSIETSTKSIENLTLGIGLAPQNYEYVQPHNSIIQTILTMGIIVTLIWIICIIRILRYIKGSDFKFVIWHILLSSMFVTGFQEMSFITLYIILSMFLVQNDANENKLINE